MWWHERTVNIMMLYCAGLYVGYVNRPLVLYHTQGKLILNRWLMHPLTCRYSQHILIIMVVLKYWKKPFDGLVGQNMTKDFYSPNTFHNQKQKGPVISAPKLRMFSGSCNFMVLLTNFVLWIQPDGGGEQVVFVGFMPSLRVRAFFHKTVRVCHVYCNFKIGFTCRITVIFGTLKDRSLLINTLASNISFSYRKMFQNGVDALSKIVDAFLSKSSKFYLVRIIR